MNLSEFHSYVEDIERTMILRTHPWAVKMLEREADIPEGAIRPKRDPGCHLTYARSGAVAVGPFTGRDASGVFERSHNGNGVLKSQYGKN